MTTAPPAPQLDAATLTAALSDTLAALNSAASQQQRDQARRILSRNLNARVTDPEFLAAFQMVTLFYHSRTAEAAPATGGEEE